MTTSLFILAHQDDEFALLPWLRRETANARELHCVYLTDGNANGAAPSVRDAESRRVLETVGISEERIHFLGSTQAIADQQLVHNLDKALALVLGVAGKAALGRIYTLAWEGGHADHDAAHLVALAVARVRGLEDNVWEAPFYTGKGLPWRLFRAMKLLPNGRETERVKTDLAATLRDLALCMRYRSQWRSWSGLVWETFLRRVALRESVIQRADAKRVLEPPHSGRLLYERMFGFSYESFARAARPFIERRILCDEQARERS